MTCRRCPLFALLSFAPLLLLSGKVGAGEVLYNGINSQEDTTGLLIWRRDAFISMHGGQSGGELTTRPLRFSGKHMFVNLAAPDGSLEIDLLDREGRLLDTSQTLSGDRTLMKVDWRSIGVGGPVCAIPVE